MTHRILRCFLVFVLFGLGSPIRAAETTGIRLQLQPAPAADEEFTVQVATAGALRQLSFTRSGSELDLELHCRPGLRLLVESAHTIGATNETDDECEMPMAVKLQPKATGRVRLIEPRGGEAPATGILRALTCGGPSGPEDRLLAEIPVDFSEESIPFPAGCADLTIMTGDYAPLRLGRVRTERDGSHDFGSHGLEWGSSIRARLLNWKTHEPLAGVRLEALPSAALRSADSGPKWRAAAGVTDASGWCRLPNLRPGEYVLRSTRKRERPRTSQPYTVQARQELTIAELELPPLSRVEVTVQPSAAIESLLQSGDVGYGKMVLVRRRPERLDLSAAISPEGTAVFEHVPPGRWFAQASFTPGARQIPFRVRIDVQPGQDVVSVLPVDAAVCRGRVIGGDEPLQGMVELIPVEHSSSRGAGDTLDDEGRFLIFLDHAGRYLPRIQREDPRALIWGDVVEAGDSAEEVEVHLPEGEITGTVIDLDGRALEGAAIEAVLQNGKKGRRPARSTARSSADGSFVLDLMEGGTWKLSASHRVGRRHLEVTLEEGEKRSGLEIVLSERVATVRVVDESGAPVPVAGGVVDVLAEGGAVRAIPVSSSSSGEGQFEWNDAFGSIANLQLFTAGPRVFAVRAPITEEMTVRAPAAVGEVDLPRRAETVLLSPDGAFVSARLLRRVARRHRLIPLAAGEWRVVEPRDAGQWQLLLQGFGVSLPLVGSFVVLPGAIVEVPH